MSVERFLENNLAISSNLLSIEIGEKSILCLDLKVSSLEGRSNNDRGPNGQQVANNASWGSSLRGFCPCITLIHPLISNVW